MFDERGPAQHARKAQALTRRLVLLIAALALGGLAPSGPGHAESAQQAPAEFQSFLRQTVWPLAEAKGVRRATFDAAIAGLAPDPAAPTPTSRQAEFDKPLSAYLAEAASPRRVAQGRAGLKSWGAELAKIEARAGVPREILLATFGMESDYGKAQEGKDIIRTLATLAFTRQDRALFLDELASALFILDQDEVPREKLRGS